MEQLELFNKPVRLTVRDARPVYWELEGRFLLGSSHKYDLDKIERHLGAKWLHDLTEYDVKALLRDMKIDNPDLKGSSLNKVHTRLTRMINAFKEWQRAGRVEGYDFSGLLLPADNPGELVPQFSEFMYRRNRFVSPAEFAKFLDYAHPEVRKICTLAVLTLLRRKDIQLLMPKNWDRALDTISGIQSKTQKPYKVPATMTVKVLFRQAIEEERTYVCDFTNWRRRFTNAKRDSGVDFWMTDLRRSGATEMLLRDVDLRTIQNYLGHASIKMTEAYLAPPEKVSRKAARLLEEAYVPSKSEVEYAFHEN